MFNKKKLFTLSIFFLLCFSLIGCSNKKEEKPITSFDEVQKSVKGTTVNFYGWGGSNFTNQWIDNVLAKKVKEDYNITLKRVPMDIDNILNKLIGEKQGGKNVEGSIDLVWLNGENFYSAKKANLLYGPFTDKLPNFQKYINPEDVIYDFGYKTEGYESPYGKAQLVMVFNEEFVTAMPKDHKELLELCMKYPGRFTYAAPPDFTGSAFVRNIIFDIVGPEKIMSLKDDKEEIRRVIAPALDYLKELKPYLWNSGKTYPATSAQLDNMFADKQVIGTMTYSPNSIEGKIKSGEYPAKAKASIFTKGAIGNTHFVAIPFNAPNKAGAMAVANAILSVDMQASKYDPVTWGDLPVLDNSKLSSEEKDIFSKVKISSSTVPQEELSAHKYSEPPAYLIPIIEKLWLETIPN